MAKRKYKLRNYDFILVLMIVVLSVIGIMAIGSADAAVRWDRQIRGAAMGLVLMVFVSVLDYTVLLQLSWVYYALNLLLLLLVRYRGSGSGAQRWYSLFGVRFQPAELAKILLILFFAQFIMKYREQMKRPWFSLICLALVLPPLYLIYKQPDLSTCIMVIVIFCCMMFVGGVNRRLVFTLFCVAVPATAYVLYTAFHPGLPSPLSAYQRDRILAWVYPEQYASTTAYQALNSMMAIGSGQLFGKGYDTNEITSALNGGFISESQTDFIFTVIGEEWGFIGSCVVVVLILLISFRCMQIARKSADLAGTIIATGMASWIGFQGFLNIGVATGVMPNTGIPLPFVSSGLTSLISTFGGIGFVLNVKLQSERRY